MADNIPTLDPITVTATRPTPKISPWGMAAEVGGSLLSSAVSLYNAKKQMQFQERMSSTAHQREVEDMRKAGLNPILSAMGGSGASTPQGVMVTPENPLRGMGLQAQAYQVAKYQISQMKAETRAKNESALLLAEQAKTESTQQLLNSAMALKNTNDAKVSAAMVDQIMQQIRNMVATESLTSAQAAGERLQNVGRKAEADIYGSPAGGAVKIGEKVVGPIAPILRLMKGGKK